LKSLWMEVLKIDGVMLLRDSIKREPKTALSRPPELNPLSPRSKAILTIFIEINNNKPRVQ